MAAIAYLGADAPNMLPLKKGDLLVVNAGDNALRAHATSPLALRELLQRGVRVLSSPRLHAKVLATSRMAVVGSVNASTNSTKVGEAVVITDDPAMVEATRQLVSDLVADSTEVDEVFLYRAEQEWEKGRPLPWPGVGGPVEETSWLPNPVRSLFLWHFEEYEPSLAEQQWWKGQRPRHRRQAGPAASYGLTTYRLDAPSDLAKGDVLISVCLLGDSRLLHPPAVVISDALRVPRGRGAVAHVLRYRRDLEPVSIADAEERLKAAGVDRPQLARQRRITSPALRQALLDLW